MRTVDNWREVIAEQREKNASPEQLATWILHDLGGYPMSQTRNYNAHIEGDKVTIANLIKAIELEAGK